MNKPKDKQQRVAEYSNGIEPMYQIEQYNAELDMWFNVQSYICSNIKELVQGIVDSNNKYI